MTTVSWLTKPKHSSQSGAGHHSPSHEASEKEGRTSTETRGFSTPRKHTLTWQNLMELYPQCQDEEIVTTTLWRKNSFLSSRQSVSIAVNRTHSARPVKYLTVIFIFTTTSAFSLKLEWRRLCCATPVKTSYFST